jgi:hypothetical protein
MQRFLTLFKYAVIGLASILLVSLLIGLISAAFDDKPRRVVRQSAPVYAEIPPVRQYSREDELIDVYTHAYDASARLSRADFRQIAKFELLQADWNAALAPLVRGLRDSNMVPDEWAQSARRYLNDAEMIKVKMAVAAAQVEDPKARSFLNQVSGINNQILTAWEDIRQAVANGDNDAYRQAGMRAQGLAQEKANVAGPVLRGLREKLGDKVVDGALERELRELARKVGM